MKPEKRQVGGLIAIFLDQDDNQIAVVEEVVPSISENVKSDLPPKAAVTAPKRTVTEY